ncbi:hypothetical protein TSMEX_009042 [Taenia solium]|eukprot:TsM_000171200 transcript=TsM_000171200 gene=TsM_000171200
MDRGRERRREAGRTELWKVDVIFCLANQHTKPDYFGRLGVFTEVRSHLRTDSSQGCGRARRFLLLTPELCPLPHLLLYRRSRSTTGGEWNTRFGTLLQASAIVVTHLSSFGLTIIIRVAMMVLLSCH